MFLNLGRYSEAADRYQSVLNAGDAISSQAKWTYFVRTSLAIALALDGRLGEALHELHVHEDKLVDEPTVTDRMAARHGRIREEWCEALRPPVDRDVIDLDPTLTQQLLDVAIGEPIPQIPPHSQHDDLRLEPEPHERRVCNDGYWTGTTKPHHATLTAGRACAPMQQSPAGCSGSRTAIGLGLV